MKYKNIVNIANLGNQDLENPYGIGQYILVYASSLITDTTSDYYLYLRSLALILNLDYDMERLDREFLLSLSKVYELDYESNPNTALSNLFLVIARKVVAKCGHNWEMLFKSLFADYNPIENYSMYEVGNDDSTRNDKTNIISSGTTSNNRSFNGFNTLNPKLVETNEGSNSSQTTGDNTDWVTEVKDEKDHDLTRSGNIGVTTSQQMIQSEIELRKQNFVDLITRDIDKNIFMSYIG